MYSRCKRKEEITKNLFVIESELESLGELTQEQEQQQEEQLMNLQKDYTEVEAELHRFYEEELETVKAGEDPLLTCPHCFSMFSTYSGPDSIEKDLAGPEARLTLVERFPDERRGCGAPPE